MKKVTKVEWVIVAEDGFPTEVNGNDDFLIKLSDVDHLVYAHFARTVEDICNVLNKYHRNNWYLEYMDFPYRCNVEKAVGLFKNGFFFTFIIDHSYDGQDRISIYDPSKIIAWAELI